MSDDLSIQKNDKTVAMFVQQNGERVQVGWASPKNESGVRTFDYLAGFENTRPRDVSFEDDELSQQVAAEQEDNPDDEQFQVKVEPEADDWDNQDAPEPATEDDVDDNYPQAGDEGKDSPPIQIESNDTLDAAPVENVGETVELDNGGEITDISDEDEEAEFQRQLAEEEARFTNKENSDER